MKLVANSFPGLIRPLAVILLFYTCLRFFFYLFNYNIFNEASAYEVFLAHLTGIRYDLVSIILTNLIFITLYLFPVPFLKKEYNKWLRTFFFLICNGIALFLIISDAAYFKYTQQRLSLGMLGIKEDIITLMPQYLLQFWFLVILFFVGLWGILFFIRKGNEAPFQYKGFLLHRTALVLIALPLIIIGGRGGIQLKPVTPVSPAKLLDISVVPIALNAPFVILHSFQQTEIEEKNYFSQEAAREIYNIKQALHSDVPFKKDNIIIIVLESFSNEYIGFFNNGTGFTPFLDSLFANSLVFNSCQATSKRSIDGITAIGASIPQLMNDPMSTSRYQTNKISGLGSILKEKGYSTSFFHGGNNGTMSFDYYTRMMGFDQYYGKDEYNNNDDDDGNWGIYDEPFFQYFAQEISKEKQPFLTMLFSLTSHHPFKLPAQYEGVIPEGELPIHKTIAYTDNALRKLFNTIKEEPWFNNTLFIITADHTGMPHKRAYKTPLGQYLIPLAFFHPDSNLKAVDTSVVQQTDILPSVLDYLGYNGKVSAFGKSVFDTLAEKLAFRYAEGRYYLLNNDYFLILDPDEEKAKELYQFRADPGLQNNLAETEDKEKEYLENKLKAIIQTYNYCLINNKLTGE